MKKDDLDELVVVLVFTLIFLLFIALFSGCDRYEYEEYDDSCDCEPPIYLQRYVCEDICDIWKT